MKRKKKAGWLWRFERKGERKGGGGTEFTGMRCVAPFDREWSINKGMERQMA